MAEIVETSGAGDVSRPATNWAQPYSAPRRSLPRWNAWAAPFPTTGHASARRASQAYSSGVRPGGPSYLIRFEVFEPDSDQVADAEMTEISASAQIYIRRLNTSEQQQMRNQKSFLEGRLALAYFRCDRA